MELYFNVETNLSDAQFFGTYLPTDNFKERRCCVTIMLDGP